MSLAVEDLLLRADRQAELTTALANANQGTPLDTLITEAEAFVAQAITNYSVAQSVQDGWARILAIYHAFLVAEMSVPEDLQRAYTETTTLLGDIAEGKVANLPKSTTDSGNYGSATQIAMITEPN